MSIRIGLAALCLASIASAQTVAISGRVVSVSGAPIAGATCQFKNIANKAVTDAEGRYNFSGAVALKPVAGYGVSMAAEGDRLSLRLDRAAEVGLDLYSLSGRLVRSVAAARLPAGAHTLDMAAPKDARQLYLLRVTLDGESAWHKVSLQGGIAMISAAGQAPAYTLRKSAAAPDSLFCTEAGHHGGLAKINGRAVTTYTGTIDIRMFSSDPAWKAQCGMPITFNFDNSSGVARYKQLIPDWLATEQEVLMEVCQATFKLPSQPKKYSTYTANIRNGSGVAATGGSSLEFNASYIAGQPNSYSGWYEVVGVQIHEAVHSYQAYYNTTGASGFGEAMPDAVRALTGFFKWPKGTKCTGSYQDVYQTGGKYWYFIEMKHPGFITTVWQQNTGDITTRVQSITGESLSAMASECQTKGMP